MLSALRWLKKNNKYYRDITIDQTTLNLLPDDGDLTGLCGVTMEMPVNDDENLQPSDEADFSDVGTFVPVVSKKMTEKETIKKSIQERQQHTEDTTGPKLGEKSISEFTAERYISCAFPTLLPTGAGEFFAPRQRAVKIGNYFKHLMKYGDRQFAKHPRFSYFALNTEMRWRALQAGRIYIKQHPKNACLTLNELRDMVLTPQKH